MIYFVTKNTKYYVNAFSNKLFKDITVLNEDEGVSLWFKIFSKQRIIANDIEATGLDAYLTTPLLWGLGNKFSQFMFDWTVDVKPIFKHIKKYNIISLGHNLLYDFSLIKVHTGVELERNYDTMLAEQRIWMRLGYEYNLAAITERYLKKARIKDTRNEFIDADIKRFKIAPHHLYYLRDDLVDLFYIREKQVPLIKKFKMEFLIYGIEFPLMPAIVETELRGFVLDIDKWRERTKEEKEDLFNTQIELDNELRELRDFKAEFYNSDIKMKLTGGKYDNIRKYNPLYSEFKPDGTATNELDLFGNAATKLGLTKVKKKIEPYPNNVNYKSPTQIVRIFAALEEPLMNKAEVLEIPIIKNNKILGGVNKFVLKEDAFNQYLIQSPESIMKPFIQKLIKLSKLEKSISTYGESFISKIHPITGRIHTKFRQCFADTGRFQSGGGKRQPDKPNFQNIPRSKKYRNAFTTNIEKYLIDTSDYTGAELLVMASHAQDFRLIELHDQDMHSYMATKFWRAIYRKRALDLYSKLITLPDGALKDNLKAEYLDLKDKATNYIISKTENEEKRTEAKPLTFGTVYGLFAKKAGKTLNIPVDEGQITINVIKNEIPATIHMVEQSSEFAKNHGFVILNDRTNSRAWSYPLIQQLKGQISMKTDFIKISEELSAARNVRIQGTQADFVKEASVVLRKAVKKNRLDARILSWVHDEIVCEFPKEYAEASHLLLFYAGKQFKTYPELKGYIMEQVANRYLNNVTIHVEQTVLPYWTK